MQSHREFKPPRHFGKARRGFSFYLSVGVILVLIALGVLIVIGLLAAAVVTVWGWVL